MLDICTKYDPCAFNIFDLETCREYENLPEESSPCYQAWRYLRKKEGETSYEQLNASYRDKAALYPEFSKVIAATFGWFERDSNDRAQLKLKSFSDRDESTLLDQVNDFLWMVGNLKRSLAGIAIIGYDMPLLVKRNLHHGKAVPPILDLGTKKPWEIDIFDLLPIWKMTSFSPASLPMICYCLGVDSPKSEELDGSMVGDLYFAPDPVEGQNLGLISAYCDRDVTSVALVIKKMFEL
jgi:hypothetical protein